jgi:hypothetical protein
MHDATLEARFLSLDGSIGESPHCSWDHGYCASTPALAICAEQLLIRSLDRSIGESPHYSWDHCYCASTPALAIHAEQLLLSCEIERFLAHCPRFLPSAWIGWWTCWFPTRQRDRRQM